MKKQYQEAVDLINNGAPIQGLNKLKIVIQNIEEDLKVNPDNDELHSWMVKIWQKIAIIFSYNNHEPNQKRKEDAHQMAQQHFNMIRSLAIKAELNDECRKELNEKRLLLKENKSVYSNDQKLTLYKTILTLLKNIFDKTPEENSEISRIQKKHDKLLDDTVFAELVKDHRELVPTMLNIDPTSCSLAQDLKKSFKLFKRFISEYSSLPSTYAKTKPQILNLYYKILNDVIKSNPSDDIYRQITKYFYLSYGLFKQNEQLNVPNLLHTRLNDAINTTNLIIEKTTTDIQAIAFFYLEKSCLYMKDIKGKIDNRFIASFPYYVISLIKADSIISEDGLGVFEYSKETYELNLQQTMCLLTQFTTNMDTHILMGEKKLIQYPHYKNICEFSEKLDEICNRINLQELKESMTYPVHESKLFQKVENLQEKLSEFKIIQKNISLAKESLATTLTKDENMNPQTLKNNR